jgi:hypothetical protein
MAGNDLDDLLGALKASPADASLEGMEAGVWARVEDRRRAQSLGGGGLRMQVAVAVIALAMGAVVGGVTADRRPARSEMVVLSDDASLTPSVAVEGGA